MTRIVLHIGPHKTGTSTCQAWLHDNVTRHRAAGVAFPADLVGPTGNGLLLARNLCDVSPLPKNEAEAQLASLKAFCQAHPDHDVILSAEILAFLLFGTTRGKPFRVASLRNTPQRPLHHIYTQSNPELTIEYAKTIKQNLFEAGFTKIDIVLFIRDPAEELAAAHLQQLKKFRQRLNFGDLGVDDLKLPRYAFAFQTLTELGFGVRYAAYRSADETRTITQALWDLSGFPPVSDDKTFFHTKSRNVSPGYLKAIGIGHLYSILEQCQRETPGQVTGFVSRELSNIVDGRQVEKDSQFLPFAPDIVQALRERVFAGMAGAHKFASGPTPEQIEEDLKPVRPQSPLCWQDLDTDERARLRAWLKQVARKVQDNDDLKKVISPQAIRKIRETREGIHSSGVVQSPCLGGRWSSPSRA